jgi:hypothetical protein
VIRPIATAALIFLIAFAAFFSRDLLTLRPSLSPATTIEHRHRPTLDLAQVRQLASLVTLEAPISDVQETTLTGVTGSIRMLLAVHGDVALTTNLEAARLTDIDEQTRTATIELPRPTASRPRLDHQRTRIVEIQRQGMWRFLFGQAGETVLTNQALASAQQMLTDIAADPRLTDLACKRTQQVITEFFAALDWNVTIAWK